MVPEVEVLQKQVEELVRERDLLRQGFRTRVPKDGQGEWFADNIPDLTAVPPMPADRQDLEGWMSNRNCEMRNASSEMLHRLRRLAYC